MSVRVSWGRIGSNCKVANANGNSQYPNGRVTLRLSLRLSLSLTGHGAEPSRKPVSLGLMSAAR